MPDLEAKFIALTAAFRFIVFGLLVLGLIVRLSRHLHHPDEIREGQSPNPDGSTFSWRNLARSLFNAVVDAVSWLFVQISTLITVPMLLLQYILRWILYFLTPIALGCFMVPALSGMAMRFFQQLFAILSWPIGFAITNVVTLSLWQGFTAMAATSTGVAAAFGNSLINCGLLLAALALLIGTIATPIVCNMLFTQGHALTGSSSTPIAIARGVSETAGRTAAIMHGTGFGYGFGSAASQAGMSPPPPPPPSNHHHRPGL